MRTLERAELIRRLTRRSARALEKALDRCMARGHHEVQSEHLLLGLLEDEGSDLMLLVRHYQLDVARLRFMVERSLDDLRSDNAGKPTFATTLLQWLEDAAIEGVQTYNYPRIRSGVLFLLLVRDAPRYFAVPFGGLLVPVPERELARGLVQVAAGSNEEVESPATKERPIVPETSAPTFRRDLGPLRERTPALPPIVPWEEPARPAARAPEEPVRPAARPEPERVVVRTSIEAEPPAARAAEAGEHPAVRPASRDEPARPVAQEEPSRAALEARIVTLEAALFRADQKIHTLAEAQLRADQAIAELSRTLGELVAGAIAAGQPTID